MPISDTVRDDLIRRARDKHSRQSLFSAAEPCVWRPWEVLDPETGLPFTEAGAWNLIADRLQAGHEVRTLVLDKPAGQIGYVMLIKGYVGCPDIYVKLTLSRNKVNGRSFHESSR